MSAFLKLKKELDKSPSKDAITILQELKPEDFQTYTSDEWFFIINLLQSKFREDSISGKENNKNYNLQIWIQQLLKILDVIKPFILLTNFKVISLVINFLLDCDLQYLKLHQEDIKGETNKNLPEKLIILSLSFLRVLKISSIKTLNQDEYVVLQNLILKLCDITGIKSSRLDIKTTLEVWKNIINCILLCYKNARSSSRKNLMNLTEIASKALRYLLQEVGRNIGLVSQIEALKQPIQQVDKYLRVTNFYLKLLRLIIVEMKHAEFVTPEEFFLTYKKAKLLPKHLQDTQISTLLDKYVQKELDELFGFVYQHEDIIRFVLDFLIQKKSKCSLTISDLFLNLVNDDGDENYINKNVEKLTRIFEECFKGPNIRILSHFYDQLIVNFMAVALLCSTSEMVSYFKRNVLNENFWIGSASTEIIIELQKYQHTHFEETNRNCLKEEFSFWIRCYESFLWFSNDERRVHIERLLENCEKLCRNENSSISSLLNSHPKLMIAMNLKDFNGSDACISHIHQKMGQLLNEFISGESNKDNYYELVAFIKLCETLNTPLEILKSLLDVLIKMMRHEDQLFISNFHLYIKYSLNLITKFITTIEFKYLQEIFNYLNNIDIHYIYPEALKFLKAYSSFNSKEMHTNKMLKIEIEVIEKLNLISKNYCQYCNECEEPISKRKCMDGKNFY